MAEFSFDPVTAFNHAEQFRVAVGLLNGASPVGSLTGPVVKNIPQAPYPELVISIIGTEVYLKSILRSLDLRVGGHHDLWRHFSAVRPDEHKRAIREYYADVTHVNAHAQSFANTGAVPIDFDAVLKSAGDLFDNLRYVYEENRDLPTGQILNVGLAMEASRRYAFELLIANGKLFTLLTEAEQDAGGEPVPMEAGEKLPINKDTPHLREVLRERLFSKTLVGDPFSVEKLSLYVVEPG